MNARKIFNLILIVLSFVSCASRDEIVTNENNSSNNNSNNQPIADQKRPLIMSHRTVWDNSTENSLNSFINIINIDSPGVEFDIRMSKDKVLFIIHDPTINGYEVSKTDSSILRNQKINATEYLPTLEDFLTAYNRYGNQKTIMCFDIKLTNDHVYNKELIKNFIPMLKLYNISNEHIIGIWTFNYYDYLKEYNSTYKTAFISYLNVDGEKLIEKKIDYYSLDINAFLGLTPEQIKNMKDRNLKLAVWSVSDVDKMKLYYQMGADVIITRVPEKAISVFK